MNKTVLLFCPVRDRFWILPHYLEKVYNLDYPKKLITIYWLVNNSSDNSLELLKEFKNKYEFEYKSIIIEQYNQSHIPKDARTTEIRNTYIYKHLANLRNKGSAKCVKENCDYFFSSDCDILIRPDTLKRLINHNEDIVAGLIYNGYLFTPPNSPSDYNPIENAYKFPNILKKEGNGYKHIVNARVKNPSSNEYGKLIEVDFTGAVFVASKDVCKVAKCDYDSLGEDLPFFQSAIANGFKAWCDVSLWNFHIMSKDLLQMYLDGKLEDKNK